MFPENSVQRCATGFEYVVFATSETMKCFKCGQEGHITHSKPDNARANAIMLMLLLIIKGLQRLRLWLLMYKSF